MRNDELSEALIQDKRKRRIQKSKIIEALEGDLTEEEADVYRRGRNAKSPTMAKNASMADYRKATGFEALMGYLYLKDEFPRVVELTKLGLERANISI